MVNLDQRDVAILTVLQEHGRITNRDLAIRVGLSPSACLARVRRLEKAKVIRAYQARLELSRITRFIQCIAMVRLERHGSDAFHNFVLAVRRLPEVVECLMLSGQYDFLIKVVCRDIARYNELSDHLLSLDVGIASIGSYVVMEESKLPTGVVLDTLIEREMDDE